MRRYAHKIDANQNDIVQALERIGVGVLNVSGSGELCDLITAQRGVWRLLEIKDGDKPPSARPLTIAQVRLHEMARVHGCKIHVVESVDDALKLHGARL